MNHQPHGWITPLPSGAKARCGGPGLCSQCKREQHAKDNELPFSPGFYWAKWKQSDEGTDPRADYTPGQFWEVVEFYVDDEENGRAYVPGVAQSQSAEGFYWYRPSTPLVAPPSVKRDLEPGDLAQRRAKTKYASMTPDQREEFLQAQRRLEKERSKDSAVYEIGSLARIELLQQLVVDMSVRFVGETRLPDEYLKSIRKRIANGLPASALPTWLLKYRD